MRRPWPTGWAVAPKEKKRKAPRQFPLIIHVKLVWGQGNSLQSEDGHLIGSVPFAYVAEQIN